MNVEHMISVVQIYIHHRKDVEVVISPVLPKELPLLVNAYSIADNWLRTNTV